MLKFLLTERLSVHNMTYLPMAQWQLAHNIGAGITVHIIARVLARYDVDFI